MPGTLPLFTDPLTLEEAWGLVARYPLDTTFRRGQRGYWHGRKAGDSQFNLYVGKAEMMDRVHEAHALVRQRIAECEASGSAKELRHLEALAYASQGGRSRPKGRRGPTSSNPAQNAV